MFFKIFLLIFFFTFLSKSFSIQDFDCPTDCECTNSINTFSLNCKADDQRFSMNFEHVQMHTGRYRQVLTLTCYTKKDFYQFLPELTLSPSVSVHFHNCDINQTSIRRLEVRLFEDRSENILSLEISNNNFYMLSGFEKLPHLEMLAFFENNINDIDPRLLHPMTNLRRLYFIKNNITHIPSNLLKKNRRLEKITIEESDLTELPDSFLADFPSINFVELECNLAYVSENLFRGSKAIERLFIRYTDLWKLPVDLFADQANLVELSLDHNYLTTLSPEIFRNQRKLENLDLSYNRLRSIPEGIFNNLENLESLSLQHNLIHTIPTNAFARNPLIRSFNFANNFLYFSELNSTMFDHQQYLKRLILKNNQIKNFHFTWLKDKYHFEYLDLGGNAITKLHFKELPVNPRQDAAKMVTIDLGMHKIIEMSIPEQNTDLLAYSKFELITYKVKMLYNQHVMQLFNSTAEEEVKRFIKFEFYN